MRRACLRGFQLTTTTIAAAATTGATLSTAPTSQSSRWLCATTEPYMSCAAGLAGRSGAFRRTPVALSPASEAGKLLKGTVILVEPVDGSPDQVTAFISDSEGHLHTAGVTEVQRAGVANFTIGIPVEFRSAKDESGMSNAFGVTFPTMRPAATAAAPAAAAGAATVATATAATPQAKHSGAHSEGGAPSSPSSPPRGMEFGVTYTGRINTDRSTKYCSIVVDPAADGTRRASVSIPTRKVPKSAKKGSAVSFVLKPHPSGGDGRSVVHDLVVLDAGKADGGSNSNTIVGALATADATPAAAKSAASAKAEVEEPVPVEKLLTADPRERLGGVFRWRSDRHFGFITRDDGKPPVYCSAHDVDVKINDGEHVSFAVALDTRYDDKVKAIGVRKGSVAKLSDVAKLVITAATNPQQLAAAGYLVGRLVDVCATRAHIMTDANVAFPLNRSCFDEFPCCKNADKLTFWQPGTAVLFKPSPNSSFDVAVAFPASWSTVGIIIEASPTESHVQCRQTGLRFACDSPLIRSYGPLDRVTFVVGLETAKVDNGGAALKLVVRDIRVPSATSRVFRFVANGILQGPFTNHGTKAIVKIDRSTIVAAASNPKSTAADGATAPVDGEADADADDAEAVEVTVSAPVYTEADVPDELPVPISAFGAPEDNWKEGTPVTVGLRVFRRGGETGIAITFCRVKRSEPASV